MHLRWRAAGALALLLACVALPLSSASFWQSGSSGGGERSRTLRDDGIQVWQTCYAQGQRLQQMKPVPIEQRADSDKESSDVTTLRIYPSQVKQEMLGFGGAITEASMYVLAQMPKHKVEEVLEAYYGSSGLRYSVGRLHINSCDFSVEGSWNFDDVEDDFELRHFDTKLKREQEQLIPFVRAALNKTHHPLRLFGSPWSPPAWMKGNDDMLSSSEPCLKRDDQDRYHKAWALYLSKWVDAMEQQLDTRLWGMTLQNEPEYAAPWEACVWSAEEQRDFLRDHVGPLFRKRHPDLELIVFDHNKDHVHLWADTIFGDAEASQYSDWIGVHWYSGDAFDNVNLTHQHWPKKHILATEATHVDGPRLDDVSRGEAYAHDIMGDVNAWASGWTDWNIVLDMQGGPNHLHNYCDAPILADPERGTLHFQPMYYYLGHFSRFLPPGGRSHRVHHEFEQWEKTANGLEMTAFRVARDEKEQRSSSNGGADVVVVLLNRDGNEKRVELQLGSSHVAHLTIPPHSIQTLQFDEQIA